MYILALKQDLFKRRRKEAPFLVTGEGLKREKTSTSCLSASRQREKPKLNITRYLTDKKKEAEKEKKIELEVRRWREERKVYLHVHRILSANHITSVKI